MTDVRRHWWWRPGWRPGRRMYAFHVTFEDQPAVQELAAAARARLAGLDGLDPVPGRWLHLTVQDIGFTDEVSDAGLDSVTRAARGRLAAVAPVAVTLEPPRVVGEGIACWAGPRGVLTPARDALRAAIAGVRGPQSPPGGPEWAPHVSLGYASADGPGDPFGAAIAGLGGVSVTVRAVSLIRLRRDQQVYEWDAVARLPLGGPRG